MVGGSAYQLAISSEKGYILLFNPKLFRFERLEATRREAAVNDRAGNTGTRRRPIDAKRREKERVTAKNRALPAVVTSHGSRTYLRALFPSRFSRAHASVLLISRSVDRSSARVPARSPRPFSHRSSSLCERASRERQRARSRLLPITERRRTRTKALPSKRDKRRNVNQHRVYIQTESVMQITGTEFTDSWNSPRRQSYRLPSTFTLIS